MTLLAIDPSSTLTGYAVMADRMTILDAGLLKPDKTRDPAIMRIIAMTKELTALISEYEPDTILVEMPSTSHGQAVSRGAGAGAATYGLAVGVMYWECYNSSDYKSPPVPVGAQEWTKGIPKLKRQQNICMMFPDRYNPEKDRGGDIADAIGLCCWWFSQQKAKRIAG